jgi:hypothetical protein
LNSLFEFIHGSRVIRRRSLVFFFSGIRSWWVVRLGAEQRGNEPCPVPCPGQQGVHSARRDSEADALLVQHAESIVRSCVEIRGSRGWEFR